MKVEPHGKHRAFRDDLIAVLRKHGDALSAEEMLALAAHLVGQLIALQDQRSMTPDRAMTIVAMNIEQGNGEALAGVLRSEGSA